jgi:hypothetical protein
MRTHHAKEWRKEGVVICGERIYTIYIRKKQKWLRIGDYCTRCGAIIDEEQIQHIFKTS